MIASLGFLVPAHHAFVHVIELDDADPKEVWDLVADFSSQAAWRTGVDRVYAMPDKNGHPAWRQQGDAGTVGFEVVVYEPPTQIVLGFETSSFAGSWSIEISERNDRTRVMLSETGRIPGFFERLVARTVVSRRGPIETFLTDLGTRLGETVTVERLDDPVSDGPAFDLDGMLLD